MRLNKIEVEAIKTAFAEVFGVMARSISLEVVLMIARGVGI